MNKYLLVGIVAILVVAGGWWYFNQSSTSAIPKTTQQTAQQPSTNIDAKQSIAAPNSKTINTSNGFSFSVPASWSTKQTITAGEPTNNGSVARENVIALSNGKGTHVANVACPVSLQYEGPYETVISNQQSRTLSDKQGNAYKIRYQEEQDYTRAQQVKNVEGVFMEIQPSTLTEGETGMGKTVARACQVRVSGYWATNQVAPIATSDLAAIKEIYASWSVAN